MYEKTLYKVETKDNKERYRLQDFTKNDNVNIDMFVERRNRNGDKRLECDVIVMHKPELDAINKQLEQSKQHVEELQDKIMQKNVEIKRLQGEVAEHKRLNIDHEAKFKDEKFNMLAGHQKAVDELNETHANDLLAIDDEHRKHLEQMRSQYKQSYDELNDRLFKSVKANNDMRGKYKAEMLDLKEAHKDEVLNLQRQHHEELETIQHAHANELQDIREQHAYDIDTLKTALADERQEHLIEVGKINERHHVEVDEIRSSFLKLLTVEHAQDIADFNDCGELPFYVRPFARGFVKSFEEFKMRKQLNTPQKIVETYEDAQVQIEQTGEK